MIDFVQQSGDKEANTSSHGEANWLHKFQQLNSPTFMDDK